MAPINLIQQIATLQDSKVGLEQKLAVAREVEQTVSTHVEEYRSRIADLMQQQDIQRLRQETSDLQEAIGQVREAEGAIREALESEGNAFAGLTGMEEVFVEFARQQSRGGNTAIAERIEPFREKRRGTRQKESEGLRALADRLAAMDDALRAMLEKGKEMIRTTNLGNIPQGIVNVAKNEWNVVLDETDVRAYLLYERNADESKALERMQDALPNEDRRRQLQELLEAAGQLIGVDVGHAIENSLLRTSVAASHPKAVDVSNEIGWFEKLYPGHREETLEIQTSAGTRALIYVAADGTPRALKGTVPSFYASDGKPMGILEAMGHEADWKETETTDATPAFALAYEENAMKKLFGRLSAGAVLACEVTDGEGKFRPVHIVVKAGKLAYEKDGEGLPDPNTFKDNPGPSIDPRTIRLERIPAPAPSGGDSDSGDATDTPPQDPGDTGAAA